MKATGCKHLIYDETKMVETCSVAGLSGDHAVWERSGMEPFLVQFCDLRGRLNYPTACVRQDTAQCHEYEDHEHTVTKRPKE